MKIVQVNKYSCDFILKYGLKKQEPTFVYGLVDKDYVLVNGNSYDELKRQELNIDILPLPLNIGGSLVVSQGDIEIGILVPESLGNETLIQFVNLLMSFLQDKGLSAEFNGNDILIDGYKVAGTAQITRNSFAYVACHISLNPNIELIQQICTKKMEKTPKGLSEFGLTTEEITEFLIEWAREVNL